MRSIDDGEKKIKEKSKNTNLAMLGLIPQRLQNPTPWNTPPPAKSKMATGGAKMVVVV